MGSCIVLFYGSFFHDFLVIDNLTDPNPRTVDVESGGGATANETGIELQMRARSLVDHPATAAADDVDEDEDTRLLTSSSS